VMFHLSLPRNQFPVECFLSFFELLLEIFCGRRHGGRTFCFLNISNLHISLITFLQTRQLIPRLLFPINSHNWLGRKTIFRANHLNYRHSLNYIDALPNFL
jgi:hypothetical protein